MNGKAAKRIRLAAVVSQIPVKRLKREYKARPYHLRPSYGWPKLGHKQQISRTKYFMGTRTCSL
jgi:hypothetical protein